MDKTKFASFFFRLLSIVVLFTMLAGVQGGVSRVRAESDSWKSHGPVRATITALVIDPITPLTLYAGTDGDGVFKSIDGGETWRGISTGLTNMYVRALAINPLNTTTIYAGTNDNGIFKSVDGGEHWTSAEVNTGLTCPYIFNFAINPSTPATLYVGTLCGMFKSIDSGASWAPINTGLPERSFILSLVIDPLDSEILYAGLDQEGIYKSVDGGNSWSPVNNGIPEYSRIHSLAINPIMPAILYAGITVGGNGLYMTTDGGESWFQVNTGLPTYGNTVVSLGVHPTNPSIVYAGTDREGIYKSTDGGLTWNACNIGLTSVNVQVIAIDPLTPSNLYMGAAWDGMFKSTNGGAFWQGINTGLPVATITSIAIDPLDPNTIYAGSLSTIYVSKDKGETWSGMTDLFGYGWVNSIAIDPVTPAKMYAGIRNTILVTDDGGQIWGIYMYMFNGDVRALAIDPQMPSTIYAGVNADGVFKRNSEGYWEPVNNGLENTSVYALAIDPSTPATLYAGTLGGVFKSTNGGTSWNAANNGLENPYVFALAIDPHTPTTLYTGTINGVFKSTNGGDNWFPTNNGLPQTYISNLAIDPLTPSTMYAATYEGVYRSTNGGEDWSPFNNGLTDMRVNVLAIDPVTPTTIYAGTDHGVAKYSSSATACQAAAGEVVINEIFPSPSNNGTEWVELYNTTDHPVSIGSCFIDDIPNAGSLPYQIPAATILPTRGFWTSDHFSYFNNDGDQVRFLKDDGITVLDSYTFASTGYNRSRYRLPDGDAWAAVTTAFPTKGQTNTLPFYPIVSSSLRSGANPTDAGSVTFTVNFSKAVTGVNITAPFADFSLTASGVSGAHISAISGSGSSYTVTVNTGDADGTIRLNVVDDDTIRDSGNKPLGGTGAGNGNFTTGESYTIDKAVSFADVSPAHPYWQDIEILYANGLTGGCSTNPLKFCPDQIMNRGQAAVFMLRANFGSSYVPPAPAHIFQDDWSKGTWAEPWAEGMKAESLSAGCQTNPLKYCPWDQVPREQAVIFALRMKYGTLYTPPPATGTVFADMTNPSYYATSWAEQAYKDGLIPNCGLSGGKPKFCPKDLVSRGLAAYMIVRAKSLSMP